MSIGTGAHVVRLFEQSPQETSPSGRHEYLPVLFANLIPVAGTVGFGLDCHQSPISWEVI